MRSLFEKHYNRISIFDINLTRLFRRSSARKIALCCMPKSGSTHILTALQRIPGMDLGITYLHTPYKNPDFVEALAAEHEIDELSLLMLEMRGANWISHMHTKWTPYTERMFKAYNIKPIVVFRNIFDAIVSLDDMFMAEKVSAFPMIRVPKRYFNLPQPERLTYLCDYAGPWYLDYVASWARMRGEHLRLNYEDDVLGFGPETMTRLRNFLGIEHVTDAEMATAFDLKDDTLKNRARLNKGVAGRGELIPVEARDRLRKLSTLHEGEVDFSRLL